MICGILHDAFSSFSLFPGWLFSTTFFFLHFSHPPLFFTTSKSSVCWRNGLSSDSTGLRLKLRRARIHQPTFLSTIFSLTDPISSTTFMISSFIPGLSFLFTFSFFFPSPKSPHTIPAIFSFSLIISRYDIPLLDPFFLSLFRMVDTIASSTRNDTGHNSFSFFYHHPNLPCDDRQTRPEIEHHLSYVPDDPVDYATDVLAPARKTSISLTLSSAPIALQQQSMNNWK